MFLLTGIGYQIQIGLLDKADKRRIRTPLGNPLFFTPIWYDIACLSKINAEGPGGYTVNDKDRRGFTYRRVVLLVLGAIAFYWLLTQFSIIGRIISFIFNVTFPFLLGCVFAFLLSLPMRFIERHMFRTRGKRIKRFISLLISLVIMASLVVLVLNLMIPQIIGAVNQLANNLPAYFTHVEEQWLPTIREYWPQVQEAFTAENDWIMKIQKELEAAVANVGNNLFSSALNMATSAAGQVVSFFIAFICAIYLLIDKEHLLMQADGVLKALLPEKRYRTVKRIATLAYQTYSAFVTGQCLEALIEGAMFFLVLSIGRFDHAFLISLVMAFMAIFPMIGAWLGAIFGALMLLVSMGPGRMFAFIVIVLVVQQIESNLIYPHVVGHRIGLPAVWTLVAVMIGSGLGGIFGILFFIPLLSLLYALGREQVLERLKAKGIARE